MNNKSILHLTFILFCVFFNAINSTQGESIKTIYASEFDEEITKHDYLVVNFYSDSCYHSETFDPEYLKFADIVKREGSNQIISKVNIVGQDKLIKKYDIRGTPTIILFKQGELISTYYGEKTFRGLFTWLFKKTGDKNMKLKRGLDIDNLWNKFEISLVFFGNLSKCPKQFEIYDNLATNYENIIFTHCEDQDCYKSFNAEDCDVILLKQVIDRKVIFSEKNENFTLESLTEWINLNQSALTYSFNELSSNLVFGEQKPALFLIRDKEVGRELEFVDIMNEVGRKFKVI